MFTDARSMVEGIFYPYRTEIAQRTLSRSVRNLRSSVPVRATS